MKITIKAIIFDCDGTLVDSEEGHILSWQRVLKPWGGILYPQECVGKCDMAIARHYAQKMGLDCAHELFSQKRQIFSEYLNLGFPAIEGTANFAQKVNDEKSRLGLKSGVASAAIKQEVMANIANAGLSHAFDFILSGHEDLVDYSDPEGVNKPKPYIYLHAAKLMGVKPSECVVIEDSHVGVTAATAAGCITVAIPNPSTKVSEDLSQATFRLDTLAHFSVEKFLSFIQAQ